MKASTENRQNLADFITHVETSSRLRLEWDNRKTPKDQFVFWFLLLFWIVWAPLTIFCTIMIFKSGHPWFFSIWCIFGWVGTLGIPYSFLSRSWREWIELSPMGFSFGQTGFLAPKSKVILIENIKEFGIGAVDDESMITLNLMGRNFRDRRRMIGYWLSPELKRWVFDKIVEYISRQQIPLQTIKY
jgi:hypothetical protein